MSSRGLCPKAGSSPTRSTHLACMMRVLVKAVALAAALSSLSACAHVKPWQRGKLAHPTMSTASFSGPAEEHVYAVQEGAAGGGAAAESGCGCN